MPTIGIIDDRKDFRETLNRRLLLSLKKHKIDFSVLDVDPFSELQDYVNWITENDIALLIVDERLQEGGGKINVKYNGSNLIEFLRSILPEFPVVAITSYPNDEDLQKKFPLFDEILGRTEFHNKSDEYTLRFVRYAQRFLGIYSKQLIRISELSESIAKGTASKEDVEELKSIQQYLNIPFTAYAFANREDWLKQYEGKLKELSEISNRIQEYISSLNQK
ncbi:hypothetical protein [Chitinophaga caseinilytica]|uniref:hypothetical protein n=1 Tax=Chitinophaga caseinilytica TaxID=2267521 RepID=UPI003C2B3886